ncbi:amidohydrolase family protein [Faecalibaculum rodentium]|uniref:amidohydrolase family protein n=1 Tax=Faecalibaculum rodentium TaxID=1702221 RepID=UPI0025A9F9EF|nr:amidohydrolase family protein [Faecalibaculum rodentium]
MKRIIEAALQDRPCDLVLKNARIVNVFTDQILEGDIGICGGRIAGIGSMEGKEETDLQGRFVLPGFIDAHLHIESSMVTPQALSPVLLSHGVATAVCDPHEIANACGLPGIRFMLDSAGLSRMDYRFTLPSSVPSCDFEVNGPLGPGHGAAPCPPKSGGAGGSHAHPGCSLGPSGNDGKAGRVPKRRSGN